VRIHPPTPTQAGIALGLCGVLAALAFWLWPQPLEVDTVQVVEGPLEVTVDNEGETRSRERFLVSAPVSGRLLRMEVRAGDAVVSGQALAWMAPMPLSRREHDEAQERWAVAKAAQSEALERWRQTQTAANQARRELDRIQTLVGQGFLSAQAAEQAETAFSAAVQEEKAAQSRQQAAAAEVRLAQVALSMDSAVGLPMASSAPPVAVRALVASHVLSVPEPSERVVAAGSPLLTLGRLDDLEVVVDVLSSQAVRMAPGMPVRLEGWGGGEALRAVVRTVEPYAWTKVSTLGVEEKRTRVLADFVDPPKNLGDGFRITARVVVWAHDRTLKVDTGALFRCAQSWCVFVIEQGSARRRTVDIGPRNELEAQVLAGLKAQEVVIRYPGSALEEGLRVRPLRRPLRD